MIPAVPADEHRAIAASFTATVQGVAPDQWDAPTPVAAWQARDVVRHLVEWFPSLLEAGTGIVLPPGPPVDDDPAAAWEHHAAAVQDILDDPASNEITFTHQHIPAMPLPRMVSQFYTADVFMHTWDLARATGQDDRLDEARCAQMFAGMEPLDEMLRSSGQYGARVPVAADADAQTRLLGFIGRDPAWQPVHQRS